MELPGARVVKQAGVAVATPRGPLRPKIKAGLARVGRPLREALGLAIGLWPLTAVVLLGIIVIWSIGAHASVRP